MPVQAKLVSLTEVCKLFRVTRVTIFQWRKEDLPCRIENGSPRFSVADCIEWRIARVREEERAKVQGPDAEVFKARKLAAEAERAEVELAVRKGELVPMAVHEVRVTELAGAVAAVCKGQLGRYTMEVVGAGTPVAARAVLEKVGDAVLQACQGLGDGIEDDLADLARENPGVAT